MLKEPTPYQVAEICYNPAWPKMPWYVIRTGTVAEQGGPQFGTESISFQTIEDACEYLAETVKRDLPVFKDRIKYLKAEKKKSESPVTDG